MRHVGIVVAVLVSSVTALPSAATADDGAPEERMLDAINRVRTADGDLPALRPADTLARAAARVSRRLVRHDVFAHRTAGPRGNSAGRSGEALALHFSSRPLVHRTLRGWLASPAHRALVLTSSMNVAGLGHSSGRFRGRQATIWVLELARR